MLLRDGEMGMRLMRRAEWRLWRGGKRGRKRRRGFYFAGPLWFGTFCLRWEQLERKRTIGTIGTIGTKFSPYRPLSPLTGN